MREFTSAAAAPAERTPASVSTEVAAARFIATGDGTSGRSSGRPTDVQDSSKAPGDAVTALTGCAS
jgi:hypothetical protein